MAGNEKKKKFGHSSFFQTLVSRGRDIEVNYLINQFVKGKLPHFILAKIKVKLTLYLNCSFLLLNDNLLNLKVVLSSACLQLASS